MFVLLLMVGLFLVGGAIYCIYRKGFTDISIIVLLVGLIFNSVAIVWSVEYGKNIGRINGLVESGKYEIVTNDDYSNNELKEFLKINGTYLKEAEEDLN